MILFRTVRLLILEAWELKKCTDEHRAKFFDLLSIWNLVEFCQMRPKFGCIPFLNIILLEFFWFC